MQVTITITSPCICTCPATHLSLPLPQIGSQAPVLDNLANITPSASSSPSPSSLFFPSNATTAADLDTLEMSGAAGLTPNKTTTPAEEYWT